MTMPRKKDRPIELLLMGNGGTKACSVKMTSRVFDSKPELVFNMEQVNISPPEGRGACPYCVVRKIDEKKYKNVFELAVRGNLNDSDEMPYQLKLKFSAEPYRVKVEGEMTELPPDVKLNAFNTCFQSRLFSEENHPPFEMARKSFAFFEDGGLGWISDAERGRSEYHVESDDGGPWIQLFKTRKFFDSVFSWSTSKSFMASPLVGWVADDNSYMITVASENAYHVGIRWGPCLHSDAAAQINERGNPRFRSLVYIVPADINVLMKMYKKDFGAESPLTPIPEDGLWPYTKGILLGIFEGDDLNSWSASHGTLKPYESRGTWINGNLQKVAYPEGVTEGRGSALWEVPVGKGEAVLSRSIKLDRTHPLTHVALDAVNRGNLDAGIDVLVEVDHKPVTQRAFLLRYWANRRLLVPIPVQTKSGELRLSLRVREGDEPLRIVLDNLRGFPG